MKILITGGAGYIGSMLSARLLAPHHEVTVLDNFMWGQQSLGYLCAIPNFKLVRGDARDMRLVEVLLRDADFVIPLAAVVGFPLCNERPDDAWSINRDAIINTVGLMSRDQGMIVPITNSGYGIGGQEMCDETSPLNPLSIYGMSKVQAEQAVMKRDNSISLRLATVFGMSSRMRMDLLVNDFVWRAMRDHSITLFEAHFRRNFVHVRDVSSAFLHAIDNFDVMRGEIYNVGDSDANCTKMELAQRIAKRITGLTILEAPTGEDPDKRDYLVSNEKIYKTGWQPRYSLDWGIDELLKGYQMFKSHEHGNV